MRWCYSSIKIIITATTLEHVRNITLSKAFTTHCLLERKISEFLKVSSFFNFIWKSRFCMFFKVIKCIFMIYLITKHITQGNTYIRDIYLKRADSLIFWRWNILSFVGITDFIHKIFPINTLPDTAEFL